MGYARDFASQQLVMGGIAMRMLRAYQGIDELPTQKERDRAATLYARLCMVEEWKAQPLLGSSIGMIAAMVLAGCITKGAVLNTPLGFCLVLGSGLVLGYVIAKVGIYDRRLAQVKRRIDEMFETDPDTWESLEVLRSLDPHVVGVAADLLPQPAA